MKLLGCLASALVMAIAIPAVAHVRLVYPPPRYPAPPNEPLNPMLKDPPCGVPGDARTSDQSRITTFMAGETITVQFDETIDHDGHFRIAFDDAGQDALVDPSGFDDIQAPGLPIIMDGIADKNGGLYEVEITLPNVPCTTCTLQLIQLMTDKPPYGDGDDVYHQCADIVLTGSGSGGAGAGGSGGSGIVPGGNGGTTPTAGNTGAGGAPPASGGATTSGGATASGGAIGTSGSGNTGGPMQKPLPNDGCAVSGGRHEGQLGLWAILALCFSWRRARLRRSSGLH